MISAELKNKIGALVDSGSVFTFHEMDIAPVVGLIDFGDDTIYWCDWFPEDQHHFHVLVVYGVRMINKWNFELLTDKGRVSLNALEPYEERYKLNWQRWVDCRGGYKEDLRRITE
jgi:hypothetical protein